MHRRSHQHGRQIDDIGHLPAAFDPLANLGITVRDEPRHRSANHRLLDIVAQPLHLSLEALTSASAAGDLLLSKSQFSDAQRAQRTFILGLGSRKLLPPDRTRR